MKAFFKDKRLFFFSTYIYVKKGTEKKIMNYVNSS